MKQLFSNCFVAIGLLFLVSTATLQAQWTQIGADIDGEAAGDLSGYSIALSSNGNRLAVGALNNDNANGLNAGHVRVYDWNGSTWVQVGNDIDGEAVGDSSGEFVAFSSDGNRLAVGAFFNDGNGSNAGHVRVYDWNGSAWVQAGADIDGAAAGDRSGSVAFSSDGNRLAVGAFWNDGNGLNAGHVRVYDWNGSAWVQVGVDIDGAAAGDYFGSSVALSSNGNRLLSSGHRNDANGVDAGQVQVYDWDGSAWVQVGANIDGAAAGDWLGYDLSISDDGNRIAATAPYNGGNGGGYARVYEWDGSAWVQAGADIDSEAASDVLRTVALSSDGSRLIVGSQRNDGNGTDAGHARIYDWNGSSWVQVGDDIDGEAAADRSGWSVAISSDGSHVAVGAHNNDGNGDNAGHVRVYKFNCMSAVGLFPRN